jgi:tRNA(Ile)-lysidine synthase
VDHGLRPEAANEARFVAEMLPPGWVSAPDAALADAPTRPGKGPPMARHDLLAAAAREAGSVVILTAHTQDDQAETFLIRARAGSGWYGLAGIQPLSLSPAEPHRRAGFSGPSAAWHIAGSASGAAARQRAGLGRGPVERQSRL